MKKLFLFFVTLFWCFPELLAQTPQEALTYSYHRMQGTARSMGFGNTLGSVGADFSTLSVNPAGIGLYTKSEIVITPAIKFGGASSTYMGSRTDENYSRFGLNNFGLVAAKNYGSQSNWNTFSFGFGVNRIADFNKAYTYQGNNSQSSQSEAFAFDANSYYDEFATNGYFFEGSPADLGYRSYLIDTFGSNGNFVSIVDFTKGLNQKQSITERGGISEILFSFGGNYQDKLLLGATIGIPRLNYTRSQYYSEQSLSNDNTDYFDNYNYREDLRVTGLGINAKLGAIYMPTYNFRIGLAVHTPTAYSLSESFEAGITANTESFGGINSVQAPTNTFDYNITTSWKAILSGTAIIGNKGFVSLDYEYVDYSAAKFNLNTATNKDIFGSGAFTSMQQRVNNEIKNNYKGASNLRAGGEVKLDNLLFRLGAGFYGSPYRTASFDSHRVDLSAGVGYRGSHAFIDLGFMHSISKGEDVAYSIPYTSGIIAAPAAAIKYGKNILALSFGFRF